MSYIERVLVVFNADGTFRGAHAADDKGIAAPITEEGLTAVLPEIGGIMARLVSAESAVATLTQEREAAVIERDRAISERDALQSQVDAAAAQAKLAISPAQARLALKRANLLGAVEALIASLPKDDDVHIVWDYAITWERNSPFIASLGAALGLSGQQIDDLFALAATL